MQKVFLLIAIQILCLHSFVVNAQRIFSTSYTMDDGLAANRVYSIFARLMRIHVVRNR